LAGEKNRIHSLGADGRAPLQSQLAERLIGQSAAIDAIVPYVEMFRAGLAPEGRPAGVFLFFGPTGTGKTRTVEALAEVLHGSEKSMIRVDCGEFQMEHEVAKLIGAPPGYLGHRETPPMFTQQKLASVASEKCGLSIVLFDEIEKAAASMTRLLLGVLDKAALRLGDNTTVAFDRTMIFLTSNLGAAGMAKELKPDFGFGAAAQPGNLIRPRLQAIGMSAVRRKFTPEFVNRIDAIVTYSPLDGGALDQILDLQLQAMQRHLDRRLGPRTFGLSLTTRARKAVLEQGSSLAYGARELKRTLERNLLQPVASRVSRGAIPAGARVVLDAENGVFAMHVTKERRKRVA
jgi:ATP-dependent Clp protease ATP-binding subunit ClpA